VQRFFPDLKFKRNVNSFVPVNFIEKSERRKYKAQQQFLQVVFLHGKNDFVEVFKNLVENLKIILFGNNYVNNYIISK